MEHEKKRGPKALSFGRAETRQVCLYANIGIGPEIWQPFFDKLISAIDIIMNHEPFLLIALGIAPVLKSRLFCAR